MNAIKPEINLSLFGRKKKIDPEEVPTETVIDNAVISLKEIATNTVTTLREVADETVVKLFVAGVAGGLILIVANGLTQILVNAADTRPHNN